MPAPKGFRVNFRNPLAKVVHAELERCGDSAYKSFCPVCKTGILLMTRAPQSLILLRFDRCSFCLQGVIYQDEKVAGEDFEPLTPDFEEKVYAAFNLASNLVDF